MLAVLGSSPIAFEILEETAAMSGPTASGDVARALARLCGRGADVIVIARGGGARSGMACWDTPELVRAVAHCRVPVFTALGHAPDRSVTDAAAAQSFPTPSAAAAALVARAEAVTTARKAEAVRQSHQVEVARLQQRNQRRMRLAVITISALVVLVVLLIIVGGH